MPLQFDSCPSEHARTILQTHSPATLFPSARAPEAAFSGLWLLFSCQEESHSLSQDLSSAEGNYWHGILHRREGDFFNAKYWFGKIGKHPILPALHSAAKELAGDRKLAALKQGIWDPAAFVDFCESAVEPGQDSDKLLAMEIQRREWQLLFDYCAQTIPKGNKQ